MTPFPFSPLIVGTMRLGQWGADLDTPDLTRFVEGCLDMGLCDFDHADIYGHYTEEARFGQVLAQQPGLRQHIRLTTKCGIRLVCPQRPTHRLKSYDLTKAHIVASTEASLQALHTDHLDLLLLHRPDLLMDPHAIAEAFDLLHNEGKVRYFGVSNFTPSQVAMLAACTPLVNHQVEISVLHPHAFTDGTLDACWAHGIRPSAWSPLAGGRFLADTPAGARTARVAKAVAQLAEAHAASPEQIALAWLLQHPIGIVPVMGTSRLERLRIALEATRLALSHEDWYQVWEAILGEEVA